MNATKITSALTGTEKQVKWADDIRSKLCFEIDRLKHTAANPEAFTASAIKALSEKTDASWWIEHRMILDGGAYKSAMCLGRSLIKLIKSGK